MRDRLRGALVGTAVGDALGLPWEGLPAGRIRGRAASGRFPVVGRRGFVSDDTEQSWLVACALAEGGLDPVSAARGFAWRLRRWFLALPPGIGLGTARAAGKLVLGFGPGRSGVRTAGNGAAMRIACVGVAAERDRIGPLADALTRVTHTDPRAIEGARVVALAAHLGSRLGSRLGSGHGSGSGLGSGLGSGHGSGHGSGFDFGHGSGGGVAGRRAHAAELLAEATDPELRRNLERAVALAAEDAEPEALLGALGLDGFVSGFVNHTVPAAIFLWLRYDDLEPAVTAAVEMGGDTDTVAAITGALVGATVGYEAIPRRLVDEVRDWPLGLERLLEGADRLADAVERGPVAAPALPWLASLARNLGLLPLFLVHGVLRRLA